MIHWIKERESIRIQKDSGQLFPWTKDKILQTYRFCNVRREDDRVTVWIRENIREPFADSKNLWFMLCIARQINWPDTLRVLISSGNRAWPVDENFRPRILGEVLEGLAARGKKVFTGAYIITAPPIKGAKKTTFIAEKTLGALWRDRTQFESLFNSSSIQPTLQRIISRLIRYDGWGPFLAHQAVIDMRFTRLLRDAPDARTYTVAGPGSTRGMNRLRGTIPIERSIDANFFLDEIGRLRQIIYDQTKMDLDASDVQGVLCETDKYLRVLNGQGKPRALYVPGRGS